VPPLTPLVQEALRRFRDDVRAAAGDNLVALRLFGSYARGEAHEDSDVDVAVVVRQATWADRRVILDVAADISLDLELCLSPTILPVEQYELWRRQDRALVRDIEREGVAL
jgi:uncharacterized protein